MIRLLATLGGKGTWVLFFGIFIGLLVPQLAALFRPLLAPTVVLLLLAMMLRVRWRAAADYARRPLVIGGLMLWLLVGSPVVTWVVMTWLDLPPSLETAIVLMSAAPPILAATSITALLGLDSALAIISSLLCSFLVPLTLPLLALTLLGLELEVALADLMLRLAAIVALAGAGAALLSRWLGDGWLKTYATHIDGFVVVMMLVFAVAVMDGVTATLLERPLLVLGWLAAAFLVNPILQLLGGLAFWRLGRRVALTIGLLTGFRNMGLVLAALPAGSDADVALYLAVAQIPMYMLPAMTLPAYRRLLAATAADGR